MESIIGPLVAAFAANTQYDTEGVVTYDHLIEDEQIAIALAIAENDKAPLEPRSYYNPEGF